MLLTISKQALHSMLEKTSNLLYTTGMKLGVFDSGIGGEAVAAALQVTFPDAEIITANDRANVPYGNKPKGAVVVLTDKAIQPLLAANCDVIILACNTATALVIEKLREWYPRQLFIGIEPMVKTAASITKKKVIAVFATRATLDSQRYAALVERYGSDVTIIEPDCSQWAYWIENNQINQTHIKQVVDYVCDQHGADVIVLGCTHYHWIKEMIIEYANGRAQVIEPSEAIGRRVQQLLAKVA
ncbi:MAG: putative Glutamate racemase [Candidatus Saccharibacteria bacterium]|nr:putative Glutamate racemase [Candidatus Saccharibacteria bacterium]